MPRIPPKITLLVLVSLFLVLTWTFGGLTGFNNAIGATFPWLIAVFGGIYEAFERMVRKNQVSDLRFGGLIGAIFVIALIPVSWHSFYGLPTSAVSAAVALLVYVLYGAYLTSKNMALKHAARKDRRKIHLLLFNLNFPVLYST